jgi:hypothetical protein
MGRDLGKAALMCARAALLGLLLTAALVALPAGAASAVDATPGPTPSPSPSVSPPSQEQIDDARAALDRLRNQGRKTPATIAEVAGPTTADDRSVTSRISDEGWWTIGAGLLVLLVASETTRVSVRRAKHRREA